MGRNEEALAVLNRAVELYPDSAPPARRPWRAVRRPLGRRDPAVRDAEETLSRDPSPLRLYQVACIYALSRTTTRPTACRPSTCLRRPCGKATACRSWRATPTSRRSGTSLNIVASSRRPGQLRSVSAVQGRQRLLTRELRTDFHFCRTADYASTAESFWTSIAWRTG